MPRPHPGSELSIEQLVHALTHALNPNSPSRRSLLDSGLQKIVDIEKDLSEVLQAIRAIQNVSVPVNGLPPEILSRVFEYHTSERDLVTATHVCRYWRSALISSPSLWTCFQFHSSYDLDRTLAHLERSKSALIDISLDSRQDPEVLKYLAPHISRTRLLIIQGSECVQVAFFLFCSPAPSLQRLEIRSHGGSTRLPDNFLGRQVPLLRSVCFNDICPTFETLLPLPNLTEFSLHLPMYTGPLRMSALLQFFSDSPLLQKIHITTPNQSIQDISPDREISLKSLVEFEHTYYSSALILPYLKLPHLEQLQTYSSRGPEEMQRLADNLPCDGRAFLAGATEMVYYSDEYLLRVDLFGNGVNAAFAATGNDPSVDWFSDQTCLPFCRIETLSVHGYVPDADFPVNIFAFENLRVLRISSWDAHFAEGLLRSLHPDPGVGIPCRSLREIEYASRGIMELPLGLLVSLVKERKEAGHHLELVGLSVVGESDQDLVEELRAYVGKVKIGDWV